MRKSLWIILCAALWQAAAWSQPLGETEFRQALRDLGNDLRLLCVAAHPDDEDGATLALHRMRHGVETHVAIATRGEGGQNEIGPELYDALGVIRTREMREAARIEGARLHFLDLPEFGFSKSLEETFAVWGREETIGRLVRLIRTVQPQVIITHHGRAKDHGHHQAIGAALLEAFDRANDPTAHPGHLDEGLRPWQPWRLYIRAWEPGEASVALDISALDPWRGVTYAEVAAAALRAHASQGMEFFIQRLLNGRPLAYYDLVKEAPVPENWAEHRMDDSAGPLFAGVPHVTLPERAAWAGSAAPRAGLLPDLVAETQRAARFRDSSEEGARLWRQANDAAGQAAAFRVEARVDDPLVVPGQPVSVTARFTDHLDPDTARVTFSLAFRPGFPAAAVPPQTVELDARREAEATFSLSLPATLPPTLPHEAHLFSPGFLEPQVEVVAEALVGYATVSLRAPVRLEVAPPVSLALAGGPHLARPGDTAPIAITVEATNRRPDGGDDIVFLSGPAGWRVEPAQIAVRFTGEDEPRRLHFQAWPPAETGPGRHTLRALAASHPDPVETQVHFVEVATPADARVGVIAGHDDTLVRTLAALGVPHAALAPGEIAPERLRDFTTVLVDMRAYAKRPDLAPANAALLDFARAGGSVVVLYQKTFEWSSDYAPYPLRISMNRVSREDAPVTHLAPEHPILNHPNVIGPPDWDGWVQERGLYFADQFDDAYTPLIACADPDEVIPPGALLAAPLGEGRYVYTGLALYRQLRALHPGALRLFANLLAG
jgi:LmbE family N-acetylglucosaminyl deacetylase